MSRTLVLFIYLHPNTRKGIGTTSTYCMMPSILIYKENLTNSGLTKFKFNVQETQYVETYMVNLNNTVITIPINIHLCTH